MYSPSAKRQARDLVLPCGKRPRIEVGQQSAVDAESRNNGVLISAIKDDQICDRCQKIDFEAIFNKDRRDRDLGKIWNQPFRLSHVNQQKNCTLCQYLFVFGISKPRSNEPVIDPAYCPRVFLTKSELGARQCDFDNSPAFIVVPRRNFYPYSFQDTEGIVMELSETPKSFCGRQIQPQVDLTLIKGWLEFCHINHKPLCKQIFNPRTPQGFRVIDCLTRQIVFWENVADPRQYVTLSYSWGGLKDEPTIRKGLIPNPSPKTIEDTILLTTNLGYRYLWIDRYCIPQDNAGNKQIQIKSMDEIYQHSVITVVSAAGSDPHYGLPGISTTLRKCQPCRGDRTLDYARNVRRDILKSKWNSRGWTYQEGLLSQRKLVFTPTQVYFQCKRMHCLESIRVSLTDWHTYQNIEMRNNVKTSRVFPLRGLGESPHDIEERLNEYLQRSLRFESDILDAFRGVLGAFEQMFPMEFKSLCGIPIITTDARRYGLDGLVFGLSWRGFDGCKEGPEPNRRLGFPSWTWVGWKLTSITFPNNRFTSHHKSIVDVSVEYADRLVLPWSRNQNLILARDKSGSSPLYFRIYGPTLDVRISPDDSILGNDGEIAEEIRKQIVTGRFGEKAEQLLRGAYQREEANDGFLQLTFLALSHSDSAINVLLLYQPEGSLHFERITQIYFGTRGIESTETLTLPDVLKGWRRREVIIG